MTISAFWALVSLITISAVITGLYRDAAENRFKEQLAQHLQQVVAAVSVDAGGNLSGIVDLGLLKFQKKNSGWYWSVEPASPGVRGIIKSFSLGSASIPSVDPAGIPFDKKTFQRSYTAGGLAGETLEILESEQAFDDPSRVARFRMMGNKSEVSQEIGNFSRRLNLYLSLFCLGVISIAAFVTLLGLRPLHAVSQSLKLIREGKSSRLEGGFPPEIAPLANEMNALIDNNRRIVERSRTQVGNLAHALKTPLAVMSNEGQAMGGKKGAVIAEQTRAMQEQIQRYLQRARIGAQRGSVVYRAPIAPILAPTLRAFQKLNPDIRFHFDLPEEELVFAGEGEDFQEVIGILLDNAAKWGKNRVELKAAKARSASGAPMFSVEIADDGPGLTPEQIAAGIKRGRRMDESTPGNGLGLAIVADTVREYGGELKLATAALGGLSVTFTLPMVE